jgi:hypothetical protein
VVWGRMSFADSQMDDAGLCIRYVPVFVRWVYFHLKRFVAIMNPPPSWFRGYTFNHVLKKILCLKATVAINFEIKMQHVSIMKNNHPKMEAEIVLEK